MSTEKSKQTSSNDKKEKSVVIDKTVRYIPSANRLRTKLIRRRNSTR